MDPDISVVICTYTVTRWDNLVSAIQSLQRQTAAPREIVVAVDHNPRLFERARTELPSVVAVENEGPQGASGCRNSGVAASRGSIVAFMDDDVEATPDWLSHLAVCYEDPRILGVGGAIEPKWLTREPRWFPLEFNWVVGCTYRGMPRQASPIRNLISANMSVRREIFTALGGFRQDFCKVGRRSRPEETELCIRALQRWPECAWLYKPEAKVLHSVPLERTTWRYFSLRCYNEGLGKAALVRLVGKSHALQAERSYSTRTLPRGVLQGLADACLHGDLSGLGRAGAILAGFAMTTTGYALGRLSTRWSM